MVGLWDMMIVWHSLLELCQTGYKENSGNTSSSSDILLKITLVLHYVTRMRVMKAIQHFYLHEYFI